MAQTVAGGGALTNMARLLSSGGKYDNQKIIVTGYMCSEVDSSSGLYATADDCRYSNFDSAIRLNIPKGVSSCEGLAEVVGTFFHKEGTFKIDEQYQWGEMNAEIILCLPRSVDKNSHK